MELTVEYLENYIATITDVELLTEDFRDQIYTTFEDYVLSQTDDDNVILTCFQEFLEKLLYRTIFEFICNLAMSEGITEGQLIAIKTTMMDNLENAIDSAVLDFKDLAMEL